MSDANWRRWNWLYKRWEPIAYRTKKVIEAAYDSPRQWMARGEGKSLTFERIIDVDSDSWPFDMEHIQVQFDSRGHLRGCRRVKVIQVEQGRSHADLCRMLGIEEPK